MHPRDYVRRCERCGVAAGAHYKPPACAGFYPEPRLFERVANRALDLTFEAIARLANLTRRNER